MLQSLKQKPLIGKLWVILGLAAVTAAIGMIFGSGLVKLIQGPAYFEPMDDNDITALTGRYLEADVDTLIGYYAETARNEGNKRNKSTVHVYIMPVNTPDATIYIGVELPKSKISDAEAVVADTERMVDDENSSYEWDGSHISVRGTLQPMDEETEQLFREYFYDAGFDDSEIGLGDDCYVRPLVLTDGKIDGIAPGVYIFTGGIGLITLLCAIWMFIRALAGSLPQGNNRRTPRPGRQDGQHGE